MTERLSARLEGPTHQSGLGDDDRIPVGVSALPSIEGARIRPDKIAADLRDIASQRQLDLAAKVSVVIDDGGPISLDGLKADIRLRPGYDHSYFFVASYIPDHMAFHAKRLKG